MRQQNIERLAGSQISNDSEVDTNGKIHIHFASLNSCVRYLEPNMALWQLGLLTVAYSELLADSVSNEDESKKKFFSYNKKPTVPLNPKKGQRILYKKESWTFTVLEINWFNVILCIISHDRGSDFEKIFPFRFQWLNFYFTL